MLEMEIIVETDIVETDLIETDLVETDLIETEIVVIETEIEIAIGAVIAGGTNLIGKKETIFFVPAGFFFLSVGGTKADDRTGYPMPLGHPELYKILPRHYPFPATFAIVISQ